MTVRVAVLGVLAIGVVGAAGCSSNSGTSAPRPTAPAATAPAPTSSASTTSVVFAPVDTGTFGGAHSAACSADFTSVQTSVELYLGMNGTVDVTEDGLIEAGLMIEPSVLHDVQPDGTVVPSPAGGCAS